MVENGFESYFRWQVSCANFIRWPGIPESVLDEHTQMFFFFFNFFSDWKIMNDNNDVLFQHCLIQVGASYVYV